MKGQSSLASPAWQYYIPLVTQHNWRFDVNALPVHVVAAAILLRYGRPMDYTGITGYVQTSELTILGDEGKTPERTVNSTLNRKTIGPKPLFRQCGKGVYELADVNLAKQLPRIEEALAELKRLRIPH